MPEASVMIVDDEEGIIRLCQRLLERAGYATITFNNPVEALDHLSQQAYDLLLVDIRMPEMDGFEVIESARLLYPEIAVVIMTGYGTLETAILALRRGADGLILKPFEEGTELVSTVEEALKERQNKNETARLRAVRPLLDMTETMFSETNREGMVDLVLNAILENLRCKHAAIYQRLPGEQLVRLIGSRGKPLPEELSQAQAGLVGRADYLETPIWVNLEGPGEPEPQQMIAKHGLGAVICTPVKRGEGGLVFMAGRSQGLPGFQLADLDTFGLLARQADVAFENVRLYSELRETLRQVERSQQALIQAEKMSAVGRLTASIAHEVNNPLQAVSNCLHLAGRDELSAEERSNYLKLAQEELTRLMTTVQRMLEFYRPGSLDRQPTDIHELIDRVMVLMGKQLADNSVEVSKDYAKKMPQVAVVDNQIQQVVFNLILNAMDAMPKGGKLTISTKINQDHIEITFQDEGVGVPPEIRESIFEPFMSTHDDGTGLGLSVSYGILTAHGGSLELLPSNGKGACFRMSLPIKEAK
jgi:signal transduction histidine kinase/CheY-like chemotaxis protein